jgi:hypothetical protein
MELRSHRFKKNQIKQDRCLLYNLSSKTNPMKQPAITLILFSNR